MTSHSLQDNVRATDATNTTETLKLLLIGDSGVGKSCLLCRFTNNKFDDSNLSTIGIDFKVRHMVIDGKPVKLELWDTAGQERFRSITNAYYRGADGIAVVYDVSNRDSLNSVQMWSENIQRLNHDATGKSCFKILVGNKIDLVDRRTITQEEGEDIAKRLAMPYFETSAKNGAGVDNAFLSFVTEIVRYKRKENKPKAAPKKKYFRTPKNLSLKNGECC